MFLQLLAALGVTAGVGKPQIAAARQQPLSELDERRLAIGMLRIVNTLQLRCRYRDQRGKFVGLGELMASSHAQRLMSNIKAISLPEPATIARSGELLPSASERSLRSPRMDCSIASS
jgi:hypothetical protein